LHPPSVLYALQIFRYLCFALHIDFVHGPEFLDSMFFGHTEILSMFQNFWNRYFWSYSNSVGVPEKLHPVFEITQIFSERSRNPGIGVLRRSEIFVHSRNSGIFIFDHRKVVLTFQKIWNRCFASRERPVCPADIPVSLFCATHRFCARSRISGLDVFRSHRNPVYVPEFLESVFLVLQQLCGRSRKAASGVRNHTDIFRTFQKSWNRCFASLRDFSCIPENSGIFIFGHYKVVLTFQKNWNRCFASRERPVCPADILLWWFPVSQSDVSLWTASLNQFLVAYQHIARVRTYHVDRT
jgi:hypothetical protein